MEHEIKVNTKALTLDLATYQRAQDAVPRVESRRFRGMMVADIKNGSMDWNIAVGLNNVYVAEVRRSLSDTGAPWHVGGM